jgi:hypothetical protein
MAGFPWGSQPSLNTLRGLLFLDHFREEALPTEEPSVADYPHPAALRTGWPLLAVVPLWVFGMADPRLGIGRIVLGGLVHSFAFPFSSRSSRSSSLSSFKRAS